MRVRSLLSPRRAQGGFLLGRDASTTPVVATAVRVCMSVYNVVACVYDVVAF